MNNYTEQLKSYWKSKDLTFIATFKRINKNAGFFNHFTNPISKMKLYYPEFDGVEVLDKRVSFYYGNNSTLSDGAYYKIVLEHTYDPKGKNNPYSLVIKSVAELNQDKVEKLLSKDNKPNRYEGITFYGCYLKKNERFASFENVMNADSGEILTKQNRSQGVYVSPSIELIEGRYYSFSVIDNKNKRPSAISSTIQILESNPYQEYIRLRFERLNNPEANKMIARLMREIGKGMYDSKQRMIFELLQNADDAPGKDKVGFHIDISGDYFFIMHDGAPFNKDDVEAITSAAESTKRGDSKKTGYKGIGFKSVFTDSTEVWLKSGGYQFAFLRNTPLFENFDKFYFSSKRYKDHPEFIQEDKLKFRNQRLSFSGSNDIPWQVIPIWQNKLPEEFSNTNFNSFDNPVQFALNIGRNNIEEYKLAVEHIVRRPQFLLFLRNTSRFNSPRNGVILLRSDRNKIIEIIRLRGEQEHKYIYTKNTFSDIPVTDEAFQDTNIGIKKQSRINDFDIETTYFSYLDGREIEEIPPKLSAVNVTEISFGISIVNDKIYAENAYLKGTQKFSSLFAYLPMEDTRFKLPFLVNADFVPSSNRQNIQGDNLWNKYIMIKVAEKHVATLAHFAKEFLNDKDTNRSYLSLLLKSPLPDDDTAQQIIESYNAKYLEQLENTEIVVNDNDQIQLLSHTIIDDSRLTELFGNEIFYNIIDTEKRLPSPKLDAQYLKDYDYLKVEAIDLEKLAEQITPELCESLGNIIAQLALYEKPELLEWLNKLVKYIPNDFGKISFILHNNSPFSLEQLIKEEDAWLINEHTSQYETLIKELGYHTIQLDLDRYSNIKDFLLRLSGYVNNKTLAYERIASNANIHKLPITSKLKLIDFIRNSAFMVGIGETKYFGELRLFLDEDDNPRPMRQLLNRKEDLDVNSIDKFRIKETEFNGLTDDLKKQLIAKDEIFTSFILDEDLFEEWSQQFDTKNINNYVSDLKAMYSWVDNPADISGAQWASIPWLYIDDEVRFETSDKVYWSKAFKDLSADKFEIIKTVFQTAELKTLPVQECGALIKAFPIKTDESSGTDWSVVEELEMMVANTLLDWMEDDGGFGDFFKNYTLVSNNNNYYKIEEIEAIQIFDGSDKDLKAYIQSNTELSLIFNELDKNLCSENRSMIGLLQGDRLIKEITESEKYDQNLAVHLPVNISLELLQPFITNLKEFKLFTSSDYGNETPEHIIIHNILKKIDETEVVPEEIAEIIRALKTKTLINGQPLKDFDISNAISFGKGKITKELHLSDVLSKYDGETNILEEIIESFSQITNKRKLRKHIFKTRTLEPQQIHFEIEKENSTFYSVEQVVFQLLDKSFGNNRIWSKRRFDEYYFKNGAVEQLQKSYQKFFDALLKIEFTELSNFTFQGFTLKNCVDKNFAIESEYLPPWLEAWVNIEAVKRLAFISQLGYKGTDSAIVNLRKSLESNDSEFDEVLRFYSEAKSNLRIIWNTIKWLSKYKPELITRNKEIIKIINNLIASEKKTLNNIIIPVIIGINEQGARLYELIETPVKKSVYFLSEQQEYENVIFNKIKSENKDAVFLDGICGKIANYFSIEKIELTKSLDEQELQEKSKLWEEPFYKKWEHSNDYPIYIYDGDEIPYKRSFNNMTINTFTKGFHLRHYDKYYVSIKLRSDVVDNLPPNFPKDIRQNLINWERKTLRNPEILDEEYINPFNDITSGDETFIRSIIKGDFELNQKLDANITAKIKTIMAIKDRYNAGEIIDEGRFLKAGNDEIIVRSAQNGLLYLDVYHWGRLSQSNVCLSIYTKSQIQIFKTQEDLIEHIKPQNKFGIVRMPNEYDINDYNSLDNISDKGKWHYVFIVNENTKAAQNYKEVMNLDDYNY